MRRRHAGAHDRSRSPLPRERDAHDPVDELRERLQSLELDALSPREALDLLYELQRDAAPTDP